MKHSPREFCLAAEAFVLLGCTQILLRMCHFQRLRRMLGKVMKVHAPVGPHSLPPDTLAWAVGAARRHLPFPATCFGEAVAAEALFRKHGYAPVMRVGAMRRDGVFQAHAWLELNDVVVVGGPESMVKDYTPLSNFPLQVL
jgi:transglutaminase superfamily protein